MNQDSRITIRKSSGSSPEERGWCVERAALIEIRHEKFTKVVPESWRETSGGGSGGKEEKRKKESQRRGEEEEKDVEEEDIEWKTKMAENGFYSAFSFVAPSVD